MTANDLRELQRDLERASLWEDGSSRQPPLAKLARAVEFAADVAEMAEGREWDDNRVRCALTGREVHDLAHALHREMVP